MQHFDSVENDDFKCRRYKRVTTFYVKIDEQRVKKKKYCEEENNVNSSEK